MYISLNQRVWVVYRVLSCNIGNIGMACLRCSCCMREHACWVV